MKLLRYRHRHHCNVRVCLLFISTCSLGFLFKWASRIQSVKNAFIFKQQPNNGRQTSLHRASQYESRKQIYQQYYRPLEKQNVNCTRLVAGDPLTINNSYVLMKKFKRSTRNIKQDGFTTNCSYFRRSRGYIDHALSDLELDFPIAFGMAVYKDIEQVKRILVYIV